MTYKEKLLHDHPEYVMFGTIGKCPADYGYEPESDDCPEEVRSSCSVCWNRKMKNAPDVGASKAVHDGH